MKALRVTLFALGCLISAETAFGYGSLSWESARAQIIKDDPWLVRYLEKTFDISRSGGAAMIGRHIYPERAGERIPPFNFRATNKKTGEHYRLAIGFSADHQFTGRWAFTWALESRTGEFSTPTDPITEPR